MSATDPRWSSVAEAPAEAPATPQADARLTLRLDSDRRLIRAAGLSQRYLQISLRAPGATQARAPVDLALVLDRSGSMGGSKWPQARAAALQALERLTAQDRVALVVFDDQIDTLLTLAPVTALTRLQALQALTATAPRGNTDLAGGWLTGCGLIGQGDSPTRLRRCFLLTDGEANVGITDPAELSQHASALRQLGVITSTIGVGDDYHEALLGLLADAGGGAFHDIAQAASIPAVIGRELGDALAIVCADTQVRLSWQDPLKVAVLGPWRSAAEDQALTLHLGDLISEQVLELLVAIDFPPGSLNSDCALAVTVSDGTRPLATASYRWTWVDSQTRRAQPRQAEVEQRVVAYWAQQARQDATVRNREDDLQGARASLCATAARIRAYGGDNPAHLNQAALLLGEVETYRDKLDPRELKARFYASSNALRGRMEDGGRSKGE